MNIGTYKIVCNALVKTVEHYEELLKASSDAKSIKIERLTKENERLANENNLLKRQLRGI